MRPTVHKVCNSARRTRRPTRCLVCTEPSQVAVAGVETRIERAMNRVLIAVVAVSGLIVAAIKLL